MNKNRIKLNFKNSNTAKASLFVAVVLFFFSNLTMASSLNESMGIEVTTGSVVLSSASGTNIQSKCSGTAITNITYNTTVATGASVIGLPVGVTYVWAANKLTISGTPSTTGVYAYTVNLIGATATASGSITVKALSTLTLSTPVGSNAQSICVNNPINAIAYATTGANGATFLGLPGGVTGYWGAPLSNPYAANGVNISGTASIAGTYNYTVTTTTASGGCPVSAKGTVTILPNTIVTLTSATGTNAQTKCAGLAITPVAYKFNVASGVSFSYTKSGVTGTNLGLPTGLTASTFNPATKTISITGNTPASAGTYTITGTLSGFCKISTFSFTITSLQATAVLTSVLGTDAQTVIVNNAIKPIVYTLTNATGGIVTGLPTGVTSSFASGKVTISGIPNAVTATALTYTLTTTGGCAAITKNGTIKVNSTVTSVRKPKSEIVSDVTLNTFPNPFTNSFKLSLESKSEEAVQITVFDMEGRVIENHTIDALELSSKEIGADCLSGVYHVLFTQGNVVKTMKVVKQ